MTAPAIPSSLKENPYVRIVENMLICGEPGRKHRAFPTGVRLPNGDVLVGYRDGRDHHMTSNGAFYTTRSTDNGRTWRVPEVMAAYSGWNITGHIGQYPDGVMPADEPFMWALLKLDRWVAALPADEDYRTYINYWLFSHDYGDTWEPPVPVWKEQPVIQTVPTDRGSRTLLRTVPHSTSSTLLRLGDGTIMGMWNGVETNLKYKEYVAWRAAGSKGKRPPQECALAGFSRDNMRTWEFVVVADAGEFAGVGFSEADVVQLDNGRLVAIYGNNLNSTSFWETHSDDSGRTWAPMKELNFLGDSPSLIKLSNGVLLAAIRNSDWEGRISKGPGIGLVASPDGGQTWELLGNVHDQANWDMGYPDLIKLATGEILCVYYTGNEKQPIPAELDEQLKAREPIRTIFQGGIRPSPLGEIQSEIRGVILEQVDAAPRGDAAPGVGKASTVRTSPGGNEVPDGGKVIL